MSIYTCLLYTSLTLDSDTVLETAQSKADLIWHDIQNAYRTRKILTGILGGIEKTEAGSLIAIIYLSLIHIFP